MEKYWHKMDENDPPPDYDDLLIMTTLGCLFLGFYCEETDKFYITSTIESCMLPKERVVCWAEIPAYKGE